MNILIRMSVVRSMIAATLAGCPTLLFALTDPVVTGSLSRGNPKSFNITVKVTGSSKPDLQSGEKDLTKDRLQIFLPDKDAQKFVHFDKIEDATVMPFLASESASRIATKTSNGTDFTYTITITETQDGALKALIGTSKQLRVYAKYLEGGTVASSGSPPIATLAVSNAIAKAAPANFTADNGAQFVQGSWAPASTVKFLGTSGETDGTVSGVALIAVSSTAGSATMTLPTLIFNPDQNASTDTTATESQKCTFNPQFADYDANNPDATGNCVTCATTNSYIDYDTLHNSPPEGFYSNATSDNSATGVKVVNLESAKTYTVFAFNLPGGINQTKCFREIPYEDKTVAEINGENKQNDNPRCFIATAAFGSPLHRNLKLFTWFRGAVLLKTSWGRAFIHWYNVYGPPAAQVVAAHPALALGVRTVLWIPALAISLWLSLVGFDPVAWTGMIALMLVSSYYLIQRRRDAGLR